MLYVSAIAGHNDLGYISSLFQPLQAFFKEIYGIDIPLPTRATIATIFKKKNYTEILKKNFYIKHPNRNKHKSETPSQREANKYIVLKQEDQNFHLYLLNPYHYC